MSKRYSWNKAKTDRVPIKTDLEASSATLFDIFDAPDTALARSTDPDSSHDGKRTVDAGHLSRLVVIALAARGPMTCEEIADQLQHPRDSISPRLKPLVVAGLIEDSGTKKKSSRGVNVIIWRIKE